MKGQGAIVMIIVGALLGVIMLGQVLVPVVSSVIAGMNAAAPEYTIWATIPIIIGVVALMLIISIMGGK